MIKIKTEEKLKLLKAVAKVYCGITVHQFNQMFKGKTKEQIHRHLVLVSAEERQIYGGNGYERQR